MTVNQNFIKLFLENTGTGERFVPSILKNNHVILKGCSASKPKLKYYSSDQGFYDLRQSAP